MKNNDCVIFIATKHGRTWRYYKNKKGDTWIQKTPTGLVHKMTAEQLLSHLLPPLAANQKGITVTVKRKREKTVVHERS